MGQGHTAAGDEDNGNWSGSADQNRSELVGLGKEATLRGKELAFMGGEWRPLCRWGLNLQTL